MTKTSMLLLGALSLSPISPSGASAQPPRLTLVSTIGCETCSGSALFTRIGAVGIGATGEIVVADNTAPVLRTFDSAGKAAGSVGRLGAGPGELSSPIAIARHADRSFSVVDLGRRALIRLDSTGDDRGIVQLRGFPTAASFAPHGRMVLVGLTSGQAADLRLLRVGGDGIPTDVLTVAVTEFPLRGIANAAGLSIAMDADGSFVVGDGAGEYLIRRYSAAGVFTSEMRRTIARVKRTPEEIQAIAQRRSADLAKMQQMMGRSGTPPPASTEGIPPERNYFQPYSLQFDEKGRLWVRTERTPPGSTVFDVFDAGGRFLGEVKVDRTVRDFSLGAGLLACVTPTPDGVEQVTVWRVE